MNDLYPQSSYILAVIARFSLICTKGQLPLGMIITMTFTLKRPRNLWQEPDSWHNLCKSLTHTQPYTPCNQTPDCAEQESFDEWWGRQRLFCEVFYLLETILQYSVSVQVGLLQDWIEMRKKIALRDYLGSPAKDQLCLSCTDTPAETEAIKMGFRYSKAKPSAALSILVALRKEWLQSFQHYGPYPKILSGTHVTSSLLPFSICQCCGKWIWSMHQERHSVVLLFNLELESCWRWVCW